MSKEGYLVLAIGLLVAFACLTLVLYLYLRKGPKVERKKCAGCGDIACPLAKALEERKDDDSL
ncbi:MAG: hypothetical protein E7182_02860 [Erysipelotrichaceae bacterium]|nr:hypothetical protein [Erysipelotrichaceae bacterium]